MRLKMISCEVFARLVYSAAARSSHIIDMEFTALRSHTKPEQLRNEIQAIIDRTPDKYDAILLGYGLCGNGTAGLKARRVPLVIPRAHDCCTIFLGSRSSFLEYFGRTPSARWSSFCYYERLGGWEHDGAMAGAAEGRNWCMEELAAKYGQENAEYIMEMLKVKDDVGFLTFIELPGFENEAVKESFIRYAAENGKEPRFVPGSTRLVDMLLSGCWNDDEFLTVPAGAETKPIYDHDRVIGAEQKSHQKIFRH